jgi:hypothetical protein
MEMPMPRLSRSDAAMLLQEARAMELLANEVEVTFERMQDYWTLAADLITLVADIEQLQVEHPDVTYEDPQLFSLKQRLRGIASRLGSLESN